VDRLLRAAAERLGARAGDTATARLEAELLLAHVLGTDRARLLLGPPVGDGAASAFEALVAERIASGRPVAYVTGRRAFHDIVLRVDARVLVPRPESELLVDLALELLGTGRVPPGPVVDRGTGSACLALCLCRLRPVLALDIDAGAMEVAAVNVAEQAAGGRVLLVRADGLGCLGPASAALIVANPPYVEADEFERLPEDVRRHEPRGALVPTEGTVTAMYARLLDEGRSVLRAGGWLITEVGAGQALTVAGMARARGYLHANVRPDLAGIGRVVAACRGP
jgi:release factor glutamine methyltransferase